MTLHTCTTGNGGAQAACGTADGQPRRRHAHAKRKVRWRCMPGTQFTRLRRSKQEEVLLSVTSQREVLDTRVHEHELEVEKKLDDMETVLQVTRLQAR